MPISSEPGNFQPNSITRRRFIAIASVGTAAVTQLSAAEPDPAAANLRGRYGFISFATLGPQQESEVRARIATMAKDYGIREFQFYDWFANYSSPVQGDEWTDAYFHRHQISRRTIEVAIDEVHKRGGRAWAYVQAVAAEEKDLEDPSKDIWKLVDANGKWHWHDPGSANPRFPTYFANGAWAKLMVARWAAPIKQLGFDGIHWDTLGRIAGDYGKETAGLHAFLQTAHGLLRNHGLRQTLNFVDLSWWDPQVVRSYLEFPYAEIWSSGTERRYYDEMDKPEMKGIRGVIAMYPSVEVPAGWDATKVIRARRDEARKHHLVYLVLGDGARRLKNQYWPDTVPLTDEEHAILRVRN